MAQDMLQRVVGPMEMAPVLDYANVGAAITRIAYDNRYRYVRRNYGIEVYLPETQNRAVRWQRGEEHLVLAEIQPDIGYALSSVLVREEEEETQHQVDLYVFGNEPIVKHGLMRVIHDRSSSAKTANEYLSQAVMQGTITRGEDQRLRRLGPPNAAAKRAFRNSIFSILRKPSASPAA